MDPVNPRRRLDFSHLPPEIKPLSVIGPNKWREVGIPVPDSPIPSNLEEMQRTHGGTAVFIPPNISIGFLINKIGEDIFVDRSSTSFAWGQYHSISNPEPHWVLVADGLLPGSLGKSFGEQIILAGRVQGRHVISGIDLTIYLILMAVLQQPINWGGALWARCPQLVEVEGVPELLIVREVTGNGLQFSSCDNNPQPNVGVITAFAAY